MGRRVSCYGSIVLRRVVVGVAVARVDGGADGRQLGGVGIGRVVVVLRVRQGAVRGLMRWLWWSSFSVSRRLGRMVRCLPLVPCHHSFTRIAVHGRATSTAKPQRSRRGSNHRRRSLATRPGGARRAAVLLGGRLRAGASCCARAPVGGEATGAGDGDSEEGGSSSTGDRGGRERRGLRAGVEALGSHGTSVSQLSVRFLVNKASTRCILREDRCAAPPRPIDALHTGPRIAARCSIELTFACTM